MDNNLTTECCKHKYSNDDFPYEIFPNIIRNYITESKTYLGYPEQYTAASILLAVSISIGNTREIFLKKGFVDRANIFLLIVGPPSANKTRTIKEGVKYFLELDILHYEETKRSNQQIRKAARQGHETSEIALNRNFIIDDFTPESIMHELEKNVRGSALLSDEIDPLLNAGKYSGGNSIEPLLNTLWSREPRKVTRVTKDQILVKNPFISIIAGTQYNRVNTLFKNRESSGFAHRFCYFILEKVPPNNWSLENKAPEHDFKTTTKKIYENLHFGLDENGNEIPLTVKICSQGIEHIINWQNKLRESAAQEDDYFQSVVGKMESYVLRFTLILHYLKWSTRTNHDELIADLETVKDATLLVDFFLQQSIIFQQLVYSNNSYLDSLSESRRTYYDALQKDFKRDDGVKLARVYGIQDRTAATFFNDPKLFKRVSHGFYTKLL